MATAAVNGKDGNYSDIDFKEKVNADLANNMGNLLNRTLNMLVKYFNGEIKEEFIKDNELNSKAENVIKEVQNFFDKCDIASAANSIIELVDEANKYVNDTAPWSLAKEGKMDECGMVLYNVLNLMVKIALLIEPYCPNIAQSMANQLKFDINLKYTEIASNMIKSGTLITKDEIIPVFLRLDSEFATNKK